MPASPKLTDPQRVAIREEVEAVLDRELKWVNLSLKILFGIIVALGIYTYWDLNRKVGRIVTERVDALLKSADSETSVKRTLDQLVNRSVITAYLIAAKRPDTPLVNKAVTLPRRHAREVNLSFDEWTRLRDWIRDEKLGQRDFADALVVLGAQEEVRTRKDAEEILAEMLDPPLRSRHRWMADDSRKRMAILQDFARPGLGAAALEVAAAAKDPRELRIAAMTYIQAVHYKEAFPRLWTMAAKMDDDDLDRQALYTCASLDPLNGEVAEVVDRIVSLPTVNVTDRVVERSIKLATAIWYAPVSDQTPDQLRPKIEEARFDVAKRLLARAFTGERSFVAVLASGVLVVYVNSKYGPYEAFGAQAEEFSQLRPYWSLLEDAAAAGDVNRLGWLAPRSALQEGLHALQVALTDTARFTVARSRTFTASQVPRIVLARSRASERRRDGTLSVIWKDESGDHEDTLTALEGAGFSFSLPREVAPRSN